MATIRIRDVKLGSLGNSTLPLSTDAAIAATISCDGKTVHVDIRNPFTPSDEIELQWYLESHVTLEPFELSKAAQASVKIDAYGKQLSTQLAKSRVFPHHAHHIVVEIEVPAGARGSGIQRLHWEAVTNISHWPEALELRSVTVHRVVCDVRTYPDPQPSITKQDVPTFNILLVVSRPRGIADVDYQNVSRPLVALIDRLSKQAEDVVVKLHVLRPPSWESFSQHLLHERPYKYYDLVHLDMHGAIVNQGQAFETAVVEFCRRSKVHPDKIKPVSKTPAEVAGVLRKSGAKAAIVNACKSANIAGIGLHNNFAENLVECGISHVLAMSYQITDNAVEIYMGALYYHLLVKRFDFFRAAKFAISALCDNNIRRSLYGQELLLKDYFIPLIYRLDGCEPFALPPCNNGSLVRKMLEILTGKHAIEPEGIHETVVGISASLLELERRVEAQNVILLHGQGGCGKTTLLNYCAWWWKVTSWIEDAFFFDLSEFRFSLSDILLKVRKQLNLGAELSTEDTLRAVRKLVKEGRYLFIFDAVEALETKLAFWNPYISQHELELRDFIRSISKGESKSTIILCTRRKECSLLPLDPIRDGQYLDGLPMAAAVCFAESVMAKHPRRETRNVSLTKSRKELDYLERILILLECNPLAIQMVFSQLGINRNEKTPEALFRQLLYGNFKIDLGAPVLARHSYLSTVKIACNVVQYDARPVLLSNFWNIIPYDLKLCLEPFWVDEIKHARRDGVKMLQDIMAELRSQGVATDALDAITDGSKGIDLQEPDFSQQEADLAEVVEDLLNASILSEASLEVADGRTHKVYHVSPIFTLYARSYLANNERIAFNDARALLWPAHIETEILHAKERGKITRISWDGNARHCDYCTNNTVTAYAYSLYIPLGQEIRQAGESNSDLLLSNLCQYFTLDPRTTELLRPLAMQRLRRLDELPDSAELSEYKLVYTLELTSLLCILPDYDNGRLLRRALEMVTNYQQSGQTVRDGIEYWWFCLLNHEARFTGRDSPLTAKRLFERNLAMEPNTSPDSAYYAFFGRIHFLNLYYWNCCATKIRIDNKEVKITTDIISTADQMYGLLHSKDPEIREKYAMCLEQSIWVLPFSEFIETQLEKDRKIVRNFCPLAKKVLAQPAPDTLGMPGAVEFLRTQVWGADDAVERANRSRREAVMAYLSFMAGDKNSAEKSLMQTIKTEMSSQSTDWREQIEVHKRLCAVAISKNDWLKALGHVDVVFKLLQGQADPKNLFGCHLQCAQCLIELGEGALAGRHFLRAYDLLGELDEHQLMTVELTREVAGSEAFIAYVSREPTSNALGSGGGQRSLDYSERKTLCEMIDVGSEIRQAEGECLRQYEDLKVVYGKLNERLASLGVCTE